MPDDQKNLNILIKTTADLAAAQSVERALEQQILKAKILNKDTADQESQLARVRTEIGKYKDAVGETAEETEKLELNHHALHHILSIIGQETMPQLGEAMIGTMWGATGAVFSLLALFEALKEKMDEVHERALKISEIKYDALIEGTTDLLKRNQDLAKSLEDAAKSPDAVKAKWSAQLALLHDIAAAHQDILDKMEKEELAAAGGDPQKEAAIKARYENKKTAEADKLKQQEMQNMQDELDDRKLKQPSLEKKAKAASLAITAAQNDKDFLHQSSVAAAYIDPKAVGEARLLVEQLGGEDKAKAVAAETEEQNRRAREMAGQAGGIIAGTSNLSGDALTLIGLSEKNEALLRQHAQLLDDLKKRADDAAKVAIDNQAAITSLQEQVPVKREKDFIAPEAGDILSHAMGIAGKSKSGAFPSSNDRNFEYTIAQMIAGSDATKGQVTKVMDNMLTYASKNQKVMDDFLERLIKVMDAMSLVNLGRFENRLKQLERNQGQGQ